MVTLLRLTRIEFAQSLDISQSTLSEIESGKAKPSLEVLVSLGDKYSIDMNWLIINRETELPIGFGKEEMYKTN